MAFLFQTAHEPSCGDPLGMSPNGAGAGTTLQAEVLFERVDGRFDVVVRTPFGVERLEGLRVGDGPGLLKPRDGIEHRAREAVVSAMAKLGDDEDAAVALVARAVSSRRLRGADRADLAQQLLVVARDARRPSVQRALAVLALDAMVDDATVR